jgi:cytochrome c oxidase subunit 1
MSTAGASVLAVGYILPLFYLTLSLKFGPKAGPNPWGGTGLEWQIPSPPPTENFTSLPVITTDPYTYAADLDHEPVMVATFEPAETH